MSLPWYQYAIYQMDAVTAATDALNKYLGQCVVTIISVVVVNNVIILKIVSQVVKIPGL